MQFIIGLIIVIVIVLYLLNKSSSVEGYLYTFNGRMAIDSQYFYDKMFEGVYYYHNEYVKPYDTGEEIGKLLNTGMQRCNKECPGNCIEYGLSGRAYCFLPQK